MNARTRRKRRILRDHRTGFAAFFYGHGVKLREWKDIGASVWGYWTCAHCAKLEAVDQCLEAAGDLPIVHAHTTWAEIKASRELQ